MNNILEGQYDLTDRGYKNPEWNDILEIFVAVDPNGNLAIFDKDLNPISFETKKPDVPIDPTKITVIKIDENTYRIQKGNYSYDYKVNS